MNLEERKQFCNDMLIDVMKARSIIRETGEMYAGSNPGEISIDQEYWASELEPWLCGSQSILPTLEQLTKPDAEPTASDIMNLQWIVKFSGSLQAMRVTKDRKQYTTEEIYSEDTY